MNFFSTIGFFSSWFFLPAFLFCPSVSSQNFNSQVEANIIVNDTKDDILEVAGTAKNLTDENFSLRYELSVITSGGNTENFSKNTQKGRFTLEAYETKSLSQTTVSIDPTARTIVLLVIYNLEDKVLGTDRIVYDIRESQNAEDEMSFQEPNEGIKLLGMVTESTKTKAGRDFYDFFYQKYSLSPEQGNTMIQIEEKISLGRTTRVVVKVADRTVYQFFTQPKLDFLEAQAEEALRQVNKYFEYLKNRNEYTTHY